MIEFTPEMDPGFQAVRKPAKLLLWFGFQVTKEKNMLSILKASWIKSEINNGDTATDFFRTVYIKKNVKKIVICLSCPLVIISL